MSLSCKIKHVDKKYLIIWRNIHIMFSGKGRLKTEINLCVLAKGKLAFLGAQGRHLEQPDMCEPPHQMAKGRGSETDGYK